VFAAVLADAAGNHLHGHALGRTHSPWLVNCAGTRWSRNSTPKTKSALPVHFIFENEE
jgi:hypothetical protein